MDDSQINVVVKASELQTELKKILKSPHNDLISKVIIGNLAKTSEGLSQLFKSLSGITNEIPWKVGMDVLVKKTTLYSSKIDWDATSEKGLCHQDLIKAHIIGVDIYSYSQINVEFDIIDISGQRITLNQNVSEQYLLNGDEWPE
jgi:hypothetical protein